LDLTRHAHGIRGIDRRCPRARSPCPSARYVADVPGAEVYRRDRVVQRSRDNAEGLDMYFDFISVVI
jgi:hypothetical protein